MLKRLRIVSSARTDGWRLHMPGEQTPRAASLAADTILELLDTDADRGIQLLRESSQLTVSIVRSYLDEELPESYRVFNPGLVARVARLKARFRTGGGN